MAHGGESTLYCVPKVASPHPPPPWHLSPWHSEEPCHCPHALWMEEWEAPCDYSGVTRASPSALSLPHSYIPSLSRFPQPSNTEGKSVQEIEPEILQLERAVPSLSPLSVWVLFRPSLPAAALTGPQPLKQPPQDALLVFPWCSLCGHSSVFLADPALSPKTTLGTFLVWAFQVTSLSPKFLSVA